MGMLGLYLSGASFQKHIHESNLKYAALGLVEGVAGVALILNIVD
jgi:hypothetical protein